jgi:hypothetical protein
MLLSPHGAHSLQVFQPVCVTVYGSCVYQDVTLYNVKWLLPAAVSNCLSIVIDSHLLMIERKKTSLFPAEFFLTCPTHPMAPQFVCR